MKLLFIPVLLVCFRSASSQATTCCDCTDIGGAICPLNDQAFGAGYTCCCNSIMNADSGRYCDGNPAHDGCTDCSGPALAPALLTPSGETCCDCSNAGGVCSLTSSVDTGSYNCCCNNIHDNTNGNTGQYCDTSGLAGSRHGACVDCYGPGLAPAPAPACVDCFGPGPALAPAIYTPTSSPTNAPAPSSPTPSSPTPFSPTPITLAPTAPAPSNPTPTAPVPTAPAPSNPTPIAPVPSSTVSVVQRAKLVCLVVTAIYAGFIDLII